MWWAVLRNVRPENSATAATPISTTTPAPVRGNVWLGWRVVPVDGAAACVPCDLRGVVLSGFVVVGVLVTGGDAATFGAFSHGGHGGWYSSLLGGEYEPDGEDGGAENSGARVVGVLWFSGFCADSSGGGDGTRDRAWNDVLAAAGKHVLSLQRVTGPKDPLVFRKLWPHTVLLALSPSGTTAENVTVPFEVVNSFSAHSRGGPLSMLRHSITRLCRSPATAKVGQLSVIDTSCPEATAVPATGSVVFSRSPSDRWPYTSLQVSSNVVSPASAGVARPTAAAIPITTAQRLRPPMRALTLTQTYGVVTGGGGGGDAQLSPNLWHSCRTAHGVRFLVVWDMTVERVIHLIGHLEGRRVNLALLDGSRIDDCELVSAGHGATTLWLFVNGDDVFVPVDEVTDAWEAA